MDKLRKSYIKNTLKVVGINELRIIDMEFLAKETNTDIDYIKKVLNN